MAWSMFDICCDCGADECGNSSEGYENDLRYDEDFASSPFVPDVIDTLQSGYSGDDTGGNLELTADGATLGAGSHPRVYYGAQSKHNMLPYPMTTYGQAIVEFAHDSDSDNVERFVRITWGKTSGSTTGVYSATYVLTSSDAGFLQILFDATEPVFSELIIPNIATGPRSGKLIVDIELTAETDTYGRYTITATLLDASDTEIKVVTMTNRLGDVLFGCGVEVSAVVALRPNSVTSRDYVSSMDNMAVDYAATVGL